MASRRMKRKVKRLLLLLLLVLIVAGGFGGYKIYKKIKAHSNNNPVEKEKEKEPEPPKEVWPKVYKASLVATGDGLLHNTLVNDAHDVATDTYDFTNETSMINDIIAKYDIAYYNQETIFGGKQEKRFNCKNMPRGYCSYPTFNSPSEFGDAMIKAGFNVVSLASNHTADCTYTSKDCLTNAYNYWAEKGEQGIVFDGINIDETKENKYNIGEVNGIKYGFLNYTNTLNGLDGSIRNFPYMIDQYSEEVVDKEVAELKEKVDVVIVAMHWHKDSAEYELNPTKANKAIAQHLADIGVNIVLGTYSHCLQPFDILDNGTVVFYSLGNFISNQGVLSKPGYLYGGISKGVIGVLASMDITKTVNEDGTQEIKVDNLGADLLYTYNNSSYKDYKAIPFSKMNSTYNKNYVSIYEKYTEVLTRLNKNISIVPYPGMPEKVETPVENPVETPTETPVEQQ